MSKTLDASRCTDVYAQREGYLPSFEVVDVTYGKSALARMYMVPEY